MLITDPVAKLPSVAELESHLSWLLAETRATRDYLRTAKRVEKWRADRPILTKIEEVEARRAEESRIVDELIANPYTAASDGTAYADDDEFL